MNRSARKHLSRRPHRAPEKIAIGDLIESLRETKKSPIIVLDALSGCKRRQRAAHDFDVGVKVEDRTVVEERPPLRVKRNQLECIAKFAACLGEDPCEHRRHQEDCWPHVEPESGGVEHVCLAARAAPPLEDNDIVTTRGQGTGGCQAAEPRANHPDAAGFVPLRRHFTLMENVHEKPPRSASGISSSRSWPASARPGAEPVPRSGKPANRGPPPATAR